ncbi:MAG: hypothetical protein IJA99_02645 [Oscillospiraceae bacterium]|nr:hypothetical protein [Oscillospiraceae bacterium]
MKKVLSLVLAVLMVLSLSVVAMAKTVDEYQTTAALNDGVNNIDEKLDLGIGDYGSDSVEADPDKPGATYYYTILDEQGEMITDAEAIKHLKLTVKETGNMVEDYAIVKHNGVYKVKVTTKGFMTVAKEKSTLTFTMKKNNILTVLEAKVSLCQAWAALDAYHYDRDVDGEVYIEIPEVCGILCAADGCEGDEHEVPTGASYEYEYTDDHNLGLVVSLKAADKYFEIYAATDIDADGEYYDVWFSGKNTHAVKGVLELNTGKGAKELWTANEEAEVIATASFAGDFEFDYAATQHVSVGKDMFVYAVVDGKYDLGKFEWNKETECWETKTMAPIDVLVSDVELKGLNAASAGKENPGTGSVDFVNVAVALGVVSLAAAGAVALKK